MAIVGTCAMMARLCAASGGGGGEVQSAARARNRGCSCTALASARAKGRVRRSAARRGRGAHVPEGVCDARVCIAQHKLHVLVRQLPDVYARLPGRHGHEDWGGERLALTAPPPALFSRSPRLVHACDTQAVRHHVRRRGPSVWCPPSQRPRAVAAVLCGASHGRNASHAQTPHRRAGGQRLDGARGRASAAGVPGHADADHGTRHAAFQSLSSLFWARPR